ncbi:MAG: YqgE/AlgH family protein [Alphaproteobacteria bacterium]|jgi:putative transcriptional regulator|nr:YqgE/AlgH family protein [Alphaproteobacteria bacterium]
MTANFTSLAGKLLIAMPNIDDDRFNKAVIYVSAHTENDGAMGLVINRPADKIHFRDIMEQMDLPYISHDKEPDVLLGGPTQLTRGFILHSDEYHGTTTLSHHQDISLTTSERILSDVSTGQGPKHFILALGCATWIAGQLEEEIMSNVWLTTDANSDLLFHTPYENRWETALATLGVSPPLLFSEFGKA